MILDRLENAALYRNLSENIVKALDYLAQTNFAEISVGRQTIDGDNVFALIQRYHPKALADAKWEAHRNYLDVQYVAQGVERIGYAPLSETLKIRQAYNSEKDVIFYETSGDLLEVRAGGFAIFAPTDIHAPCLAHETTQPDAEVLKVVVKCRVASI
jgi:YhcH/YjgK/YiaL family protein